jgi:hypothetical protein
MERFKALQDLESTKSAMQDRQAYLAQVILDLRKCDCTPSEEKERKLLIRYCQIKVKRNSAKINAINDQIYKIEEASRRDAPI